MFSLIDIIVAVVLGGLIGAIIVLLCFWRGYSNILKRIDRIVAATIEQCVEVADED